MMDIQKYESAFAGLNYKLQNEFRKKIWVQIIAYLDSQAKDNTQNSFDVQIFEDFVTMIKEAKTTDDWNTFTSDITYVKFVDENGNVYLRFKSLYRIIQRDTAQMKLYTEKKVFKLLKKLGAQMVRLHKGGKKPRLWLLPAGLDWIFGDEPETAEKPTAEKPIQQGLEIQEPVKEPEKVLLQEPEKVLLQEPEPEPKEVKVEPKANGNRNGNGARNGNEKGTETAFVPFDMVHTEKVISESEKELIRSVCPEGLDPETLPEWYRKELLALAKECQKVEGQKFDDEIPF